MTSTTARILSVIAMIIDCALVSTSLLFPFVFPWWLFITAAILAVHLLWFKTIFQFCVYWATDEFPAKSKAPKNRMTWVLAPVLIGALIAGRPAGDNSRATVAQISGLFVFTDATPTGQYTYLGTVQNGITARSTQYQPVRDRLIKKLKEQYPTADGVIFHFVNNAPDKADAIKFAQ